MDGPASTRRQPFGSNSQVGEKGTETEARILRGALAVFAKVGFDETRVELITQRAGCSRPAFYQYFSNKDEVFWRLARELGRKMVTLARSLAPIGADAEGVRTLAVWVDEFTSLYQTYAPIFMAFQPASRHNLELARESSAFGGRLDTALLRAFGRDAHRRDKALASAVAAMLIRCSFYWDSLVASEAVTKKRLVDGLAGCTHRIFYGPIDGVNIEPVSTRRGSYTSRGPTFDELPASDAPRTLRSRGRATRQRLLDAGAEVLPARGYHSARVEDIVSAAGVSHGSFYRYFGDKDDFFRTMAERAGAEMVRLLERFPIDEGEAELRAWLGEWFESYRSNGGVITTWQEMQEGGEALVAYSQQVAGVIVAGLVGMLDQRGQDDPLFDSLALLALIERLPYRAYTLGFATPKASIDAAATIIRRGVMGLAT